MDFWDIIVYVFVFFLLDSVTNLFKFINEAIFLLYELQSKVFFLLTNNSLLSLMTMFLFNIKFYTKKGIFFNNTFLSVIYH